MSAWLAPVFLIVGFLIGALVQPDSYHWAWDTISALATHEANQRWWMNGGFVGNGLCHLLTAWQMPRSWGRNLIALGGVGVLMVAAFPEQPHGDSTVHAVGAGIAFFSLATWPLFALDERRWATRKSTAVKASAVMLGLLAWFLLTLVGVPAIGVVERALAVVEAIWPIFVIESLRQASAPRDVLRPNLS